MVKSLLKRQYDHYNPIPKDYSAYNTDVLNMPVLRQNVFTPKAQPFNLSPLQVEGVADEFQRPYSRMRTWMETVGGTLLSLSSSVATLKNPYRPVFGDENEGSQVLYGMHHADAPFWDEDLFDDKEEGAINLRQYLPDPKGRWRDAVEAVKSAAQRKEDIGVHLAKSMDKYATDLLKEVVLRESERYVALTPSSKEYLDTIKAYQKILQDTFHVIDGKVDEEFDCQLFDEWLDFHHDRLEKEYCSLRNTLTALKDELCHKIKHRVLLSEDLRGKLPSEEKSVESLDSIIPEGLNVSLKDIVLSKSDIENERAFVRKSVESDNEQYNASMQKMIQFYKDERHSLEVNIYNPELSTDDIQQALRVITSHEDAYNRGEFKTEADSNSIEKCILQMKGRLYDGAIEQSPETKDALLKQIKVINGRISRLEEEKNNFEARSQFYFIKKQLPKDVGALKEALETLKQLQYEFTAFKQKNEEYRQIVDALFEEDPVVQLMKALKREDYPFLKDVFPRAAWASYKELREAVTKIEIDDAVKKKWVDIFGVASHYGFSETSLGEEALEDAQQGWELSFLCDPFVHAYKRGYFTGNFEEKRKAFYAYPYKQFLWVVTDKSIEKIKGLGQALTHAMTFTPADPESPEEWQALSRFFESIHRLSKGIAIEELLGLSGSYRFMGECHETAGYYLAEEYLDLFSEFERFHPQGTFDEKEAINEVFDKLLELVEIFSKRLQATEQFQEIEIPSISMGQHEKQHLLANPSYSFRTILLQSNTLISQFREDEASGKLKTTERLMRIAAICYPMLCEYQKFCAFQLKNDNSVPKITWPKGEGLFRSILKNFKSFYDKNDYDLMRAYAVGLVGGEKSYVSIEEDGDKVVTRRKDASWFTTLSDRSELRKEGLVGQVFPKECYEKMIEFLASLMEGKKLETQPQFRRKLSEGLRFLQVSTDQSLLDHQAQVDALNCAFHRMARLISEHPARPLPVFTCLYEGSRHMWVDPTAEPPGRALIEEIKDLAPLAYDFGLTPAVFERDIKQPVGVHNRAWAAFKNELGAMSDWYRKEIRFKKVPTKVEREKFRRHFEALEHKYLHAKPLARICDSMIDLHRALQRMHEHFPEGFPEKYFEELKLQLDEAEQLVVVFEAQIKRLAPNPDASDVPLFNETLFKNIRQYRLKELKDSLKKVSKKVRARLGEEEDDLVVNNGFVADVSVDADPAVFRTGATSWIKRKLGLENDPDQKDLEEKIDSRAEKHREILIKYLKKLFRKEYEEMVGVMRAACPRIPRYKEEFAGTQFALWMESKSSEVHLDVAQVKTMLDFIEKNNQDCVIESTGPRQIKYTRFLLDALDSRLSLLGPWKFGYCGLEAVFNELFDSYEHYSKELASLESQQLFFEKMKTLVAKIDVEISNAKEKLNQDNASAVFEPDKGIKKYVAAKGKLEIENNLVDKERISLLAKQEWLKAQEEFQRKEDERREAAERRREQGSKITFGFSGETRGLPGSSMQVQP